MAVAQNVLSTVALTQLQRAMLGSSTGAWLPPKLRHMTRKIRESRIERIRKRRQGVLKASALKLTLA
jgi:hypothetical protein